MRWVVSLVVVLCLAVPLSAAASPSGGSKADAVLMSMVNTALAQRSVHWTQDVTRSTASIAHRQWISDVNTTNGKQIGLLGYPFAGGKVWEVFIHGVVYIRGNAAGLRDAIDLTKAEAAKGAGEWLSIPKTSQFYGETRDGLTLASIVNDETPGGSLKLIKSTGLDGTRLVTVQETDAWLAALTAPASGAPLPITFDEVLSPDENLHGTFSRWNATVPVAAPAKSVPIATIRRG